MEDPSSVREADYLFMESTYGNRNHKGEQESLDELAEAIAYSYANGEKVVIPAFAVERTQEILYSLHLLLQAGKLPKDMPVYLDSPLAIKATEIFHRYRDYLDGATQDILKNGGDPLRLPNLKMSTSTADSIRINETKEAAIVISASGMCNAGRIKHHLRHNLWKTGASIVFVGFQAQGTPGRRIVDGAKKSAFSTRTSPWRPKSIPSTASPPTRAGISCLPGCKIFNPKPCRFFWFTVNFPHRSIWRD